MTGQTTTLALTTIRLIKAFSMHRKCQKLSIEYMYMNLCSPSNCLKNKDNSISDNSISDNSICDNSMSDNSISDHSISYNS